uniref:Uncharacterized protein n=1 Tax=Rhizophora mucronata TaxID=61149 RepID=A0A2P2ILF4_RHIMU
MPKYENSQAWKMNII